MKLLLKIAYIGTGYAGYQAQDRLPSVQGTLTACISEALGFECKVTGCSRTDSGVHALGFCAAVEPKNYHDNWLTIPEGKVHRVINRFLPNDISVCGETVIYDDNFHPRYNVTEKTYMYRMYDSVAEDPFLVNRAWHLKKQVTDMGLYQMSEAADLITGRKDFSSFMASGSKITDAVRNVTKLSVTKTGKTIELSVSADGFLYNMVRIITGTLLDCAYSTIDPKDIPKILSACDRTKAGRTAPAYGLYLTDVKYDREILWKCE